jgi:hypothetical protein
MRVNEVVMKILALYKWQIAKSERLEQRLMPENTPS